MEYPSHILVTTCSSESFATTFDPSLGAISFPTCVSSGTTSIIGTIQVAAEAIFVKYQPSDLPVLHEASPGLGAWPGILVPTSSPAGASGGLSQDAKIAIGVTIPVVFLAFALGVFVALRWRNRVLSTRARSDPVMMPELQGRPAPPMAAAQVAEPEPGWVHGGARGQVLLN